jgi:hypothetical protein
MNAPCRISPASIGDSEPHRAQARRGLVARVRPKAAPGDFLRSTRVRFAYPGYVAYGLIVFPEPIRRKPCLERFSGKPRSGDFRCGTPRKTSSFRDCSPARDPRSRCSSPSSSLESGAIPFGSALSLQLRKSFLRWQDAQRSLDHDRTRRDPTNRRVSSGERACNAWQ